MNTVIKQRPGESRTECAKDWVWVVTVHDKIGGIGTFSDDIIVDYEVVAFDEAGAISAAKHRHNVEYGTSYEYVSNVLDLISKYEKAVAVLEQIRHSASLQKYKYIERVSDAVLRDVGREVKMPNEQEFDKEYNIRWNK